MSDTASRCSVHRPVSPLPRAGADPPAVLAVLPRGAGATPLSPVVGVEAAAVVLVVAGLLKRLPPKILVAFVVAEAAAGVVEADSAGLEPKRSVLLYIRTVDGDAGLTRKYWNMC